MHCHLMVPPSCHVFSRDCNWIFLLQVVKKSAAPQQAAIVMTWPQISRRSIFSASRFGRVPFPRGSPYQVRPPMKAGTVTSSVSEKILFPNTPRSLTYVRAEAKANGNSSTVQKKKECHF